MWAGLLHLGHHLVGSHEFLSNSGVSLQAEPVGEYSCHILMPVALGSTHRQYCLIAVLGVFPPVTLVSFMVRKNNCIVDLWLHII